jgi:hypothetical protein
MHNPLRLFLNSFVFQEGEGDQVAFVEVARFEIFR